MTETEESKIWWDKTKKIARAQAICSFDEKVASEVLQETQKMADKHERRIDWLIDLSQSTHSTSSSRKIMAKAARHPSVRKCALIGASIFIRTIANFIMAAAGQKNARHFDSEEEALDWIKKEKTMNEKIKYKVWWDEKEGIIRNKTWGDFDEEDAQGQADEIIGLVNKMSEKGNVSILNDLSESGTATSGARKIFSQLMKQENIKKQAFVGMKIVTRVIVSFIMNFSGVKNAQYFKTENEALQWLKGDQNAQI